MALSIREARDWAEKATSFRNVIYVNNYGCVDIEASSKEDFLSQLNALSSNGKSVASEAIN